MKTNFSLQAVLVFLFLSFGTLITAGAAESFPFRAISPGDRMPDVKILNAETGKETALRPNQNRQLLVVFWGADLPTKKDRSIKTLSEVQGLTAFLAEKKVDLLIVNVQGDSRDTINDIIASSGTKEPVYLDPDQKAYGALGIFVMPSLLLIDKNGTVVTGLGYSKEMKQRLQGEIEILLGEKTRAQVEGELHAPMADKSQEEKDAARHLNLGRSMLEKGQLETARDEFQRAITSNPKLAEAYVELGCVCVELGKNQEGQVALDKALDLLPGGSLPAEICMAQIKAASGAVDEAMEDLQPLIFRNGRDPRLHYVLGTFYARKENHSQAAKEFRKAYELLSKKQEHAP